MMDLLPLEWKYCEAVEAIAKKSLPEHWSLESIQDVLRYKNNIYYVARDVERETIFAFAGIMIVADEAELLNIAVLEEYRRRGAAQRLLEVLSAKAQEAGAYRLLLEVRKSNTSARSLYEKNDFHTLGERKNYYSNPKEDAILMEKIF